KETSLPEERRRRLLDLLRQDGKIVAAEASRQLDVSEDTVRRDLNELAAAGQLRRVHGGALPLLPLTPAAAPFLRRQDEDDGSRRTLAARLAQLIQPGSTVLLDSGTTNLAVAEAIAPDLQATIITPSLPAAMALMSHRHVGLIVLGGTVDKAERSTEGIATWEAIAGLSVDLCLLGICGIDAQAGLMEMSPDAARLKARMIGSASRVVTAASARKLGTRAPYRIGPVELLTCLVTEARVPDAVLDPYRQAGIEILLAA
ncbi:MAG TPA: DeoR/GlpR family DNA-binding transcription regulator, partial [Dongiaceae bacterium]|nr:DeoR/GlpR family DNA-binding transcription regulator [Dongiaceae bacterium]